MTQERRPIIRLSAEVVGKIAAGEVVERPAAAIKELIENSIDAGATAVSVEIKEGGISYFRVTDNGSGIATGDIRMAFERHATSKIRSSEDLFAIQTLGFRGEALASIAAVSRMTCTTRTHDDEHGLTAVNEGGVMVDIREAACPEGTTFIVRDLFYNTPVRLKFLKKPAYEASLVSDLVLRMILSNPGISFRFISQGKVIYHSAGDGKMESAVYSIYGREMLDSMRRVQDNAGGVCLDGYVGIGESARGNRNHQSFFINGRYMKSPLLSQALEAACKERVTIGHFPTCVLHLTMPYSQVDVNVHPNKLEVRFQNERLVFESVRDMVARVLQEDTPFIHIPDMALEVSREVHPKPEIHIKQTRKIPNLVHSEPALSPPTLPDKPHPPRVEVAPPAPSLQESAFRPSLPVQRPVGQKSVFPPQPAVTLGSLVKASPDEPASPPPPIQPAVPCRRPVQAQEISLLDDLDEKESAVRPLVKIIGVAFQTFILAEYGEQLLLIDQHAVHERLLYDRMMKAYDQHAASQALLVPQVVELTHREAQTLEENREALSQAGFELAFFGGNSLQLRGVPMILGIPQAKACFLDILDQLEGQRNLVTLDKRRNAILQMACKKAVKGGDPLTQMEVEDLVRQMAEQGITPTCPHGRPLVVAISRTEMDKRFKRIQ